MLFFKYNVLVVFTVFGLSITFPEGQSGLSLVSAPHKTQACGLFYHRPKHLGRHGRKGLVDIYYLNETAARLENEGFNVTVNNMHMDAIFNISYSNGTHKGQQFYFGYEARSPVGGRVASRVRGYYMALLGRRQENGSIIWLCDGVLINLSWILSAAHCFLSSTSPDVVRLGEFDWLQEPQNPHGVRPMDYEIAQAVFHPKFTRSSRYYDLILLKIPTKISLYQNMRPICLPWGEEMFRNHIEANATLTGWGATSYNSPTKTNILQEVDLTVFNVSLCNNAYKKLRYYKRRFPMGMTEDTILCAGDENGGKDACQGDSGGPLTYQVDDYGFIYLLGIVSGGHGCGKKGYPGLYTPINTIENLSWIKEVAFGEL